METLTRIVSNEYRQKNNLDENSRVYLTPHMQKIFVNSPEFMEPLRWDFESTIAYKKIEKNEIQTRPITFEEFDRLDESQKKMSKHLSYMALIVCAMVCIMVIAVMITADFSTVTKEVWVFMGLVIFIFILAGFSVFISANSSILKPDSQIAKGNAVLLNKPCNGNATRYYVMVAFDNQQAYVGSIGCSWFDYNKMSVGSKVYVKVKGSSAIAYANYLP